MAKGGRESNKARGGRRENFEEKMMEEDRIKNVQEIDVGREEERKVAGEKKGDEEERKNLAEEKKMQ